jgi:hypothetical protein
MADGTGQKFDRKLVVSEWNRSGLVWKIRETRMIEAGTAWNKKTFGNSLPDSTTMPTSLFRVINISNIQ